ncbi:Enoyl-CoA delta isomerase 1; mitochondrial [Camelus dromedarius]|uniref:Enoyl-CoA delta isomerase 1 n=1 Tax=Camelus dromedarius TaxID=9838 RepID=A0A5N4BZ51_CAMDR|nr:Enoyl-CoA delta isomerase 1; mitochondrial [Camelus dromedarius]
MSFVLFIFKPGVTVLKLKSPPVNSLSLELLTELVISLEKLEHDKTFQGILLTSDCPGVFSAGLDLTELCGKNPAHYAEFWKAMQEMWLRLYLSNLVLIAAINDQVLSTVLSVMAQWMAIPDHTRQLTKNMMQKPTADHLLKQRDTDIQYIVSVISRDSIQKSLKTYLEKLK